jgi:Phasin protein
VGLHLSRDGERFTNIFDPVREESQPSSTLAQIFQSGSVVASAMRSIFHEIFNFMQERMHQNFTSLLILTHCRTPAQLLAAQGELMRDNGQGFFRSTGRIANVSMQMTHEVMRRMDGVSLVRQTH